MIWIYFTCSRS